MRNDLYPEGGVSQLLNTDEVTPVTKYVLTQRLASQTGQVANFFNSSQMNTLQAVCAELVPQTRKDPVNLALLLDRSLVANSGNGWRYASMPADKIALTSGLAAIESEAMLQHQQSFHLLTRPAQQALLQSVQNGATSSPAWDGLPASLFFEELLAQIVELYYSHPAAKDEIGDISFADAKGWDQIGLDQQTDHKPISLKSY